MTIAALLVVLGICPSAAAQTAPPDAAAPLDPGAYASALRNLSERVRLAEAGAAADVARHVPAVWRVDAGEGVVDVPGVLLQRTLREAGQSPDAWPRVRARILETLAAAERDAREMVHVTPHDPGAARATLNEVLARPEFAQVSRDTRAL